MLRQSDTLREKSDQLSTETIRGRKKFGVKLNLGNLFGIRGTQTLKTQNMKKLMATVGVLALLVGNSFSQDKLEQVEGHPHKMHAEKGKRHGMMADIPNLTDTQKAEIKSIKEASRKQAEPQRKQMKQVRMKLNELKTAENPDQNQINELIDKSAKMKAEMEKSRTASELKVRSILTPEQRKVVDAKRKERMEMREKRHAEKKEMREAK